jgi:hypothetical protein
MRSVEEYKNEAEGCQAGKFRGGGQAFPASGTARITFTIFTVAATSVMISERFSVAQKSKAFHRIQRRLVPFFARSIHCRI